MSMPILSKVHSLLSGSILHCRWTEDDLREFERRILSSPRYIDDTYTHRIGVSSSEAIGGINELDESRESWEGAVNLRQLEIFGAVMGTGTTVGAAQLLNMSQPAVSNAIMQLERNLNVPLFNRVKGRLQPTEEAELLYGKSLDVFSSFEAARAVAGQLRERTVGHLRLVATPSLGSSIMPLAVRGFRRQRPNVRVSMTVGGVEEVQDMVSKEEANLGFYYITTDHPLLVCEPLASFDMLCALPINHRLSGADVVRAVDLEGETLISYSANERLAAVVESAFGADGCDHRPAIDVRFVHSACELVAQGIGIAVVDAFMALRAEIYQSVVFKPFRPRTTMPIYVCTHRDRARSALSSLFLEDLRQLFGDSIEDGVFTARMHTAGGSRLTRNPLAASSL